MRYFIYACEDMYEGLHGIEDYRIEEDIDEGVAHEIGREMSYEVIQSYDLSDYEDMDDEEIDEHLSWQIYLIDEDKAGFISTRELNSMACAEGAEEFINLYCKEV